MYNPHLFWWDAKYEKQERIHSQCTNSTAMPQSLHTMNARITKPAGTGNEVLPQWDTAKYGIKGPSSFWNNSNSQACCWRARGSSVLSCFLSLSSIVLIFSQVLFLPPIFVHLSFSKMCFEAPPRLEHGYLYGGIKTDIHTKTQPLHKVCCEFMGCSHELKACMCKIKKQTAITVWLLPTD